jgi:hypothetical protein
MVDYILVVWSAAPGSKSEARVIWRCLDESQAEVKFRIKTYNIYN